MQKFYQFSANGQSRKYARILKIQAGRKKYYCSLEAIEYSKLDDVVSVLLDSSGQEWPDALGNFYSGPFAISQRVKDLFDREGIGYLQYHSLNIVRDKEYEDCFPAILSNIPPPAYYLINNEIIGGISIEYEKSGMFYKHKCPECNRLIRDDKRTNELILRGESNGVKRHAPLSFRENSWNGRDVFGDENLARLFCTERIIELAKNNHLTNFAFIPFEKGQFGHSIRYLKKKK